VRCQQASARREEIWLLADEVDIAVHAERPAGRPAGRQRARGDPATRRRGLDPAASINLILLAAFASHALLPSRTAPRPS